MIKIIALCLIALIIIPTTIYADNVKEFNIISQQLTHFSSLRKQIEEVVIIPGNNPFFGLIGSYLSCWYGSDNGSSGLLPLLVQHNQKLTENQYLFLDQYIDKIDKKLLVLKK